MYIPPSFVVTDTEQLHAFMARHSFATLVSQHENSPFASHLPLLFDAEPPPHGRLIGHMARANPQWESAAGQRVLAIFHGPHAYISPTWYEATNVVPTWNYVAVHVTGTLRLIEDRDRLREVLRRTVAIYEAGRSRPWSMESPDAEFLDKLLAAIVGFEIEIEQIEGKWKLSQNHPAERREKVVLALERSGGHDALVVAKLMTATLPEPSASRVR
jgi:transcriptional regulator